MTESGRRRAARAVVCACCSAPRPGVGKTFEMLVEGRRLLDEGRDVVIAIVETHDRAATARADGRPPRGPPPHRRAPRGRR